ncbi:kelch repeat and BTB domain-containing protein 13 [Neosynchiropus ocellatus]
MLMSACGSDYKDLRSSEGDGRNQFLDSTDTATAKLTLVVEETNFCEEKIVLVRNCEFFQALYRSGMKECHQEEIHLSCLHAGGFLFMLDVFRGRSPAIDGDSLVQAIECAAYLQVSLLTKYLIDLIDSDNCLLMFHSAAIFGLMDLYHAAAHFIRDMYPDLQEEVKINLPAELVLFVEALRPSVLVAVGAHVTCGSGETVHAASRTVCYLDENSNEWKMLTDLPPEASTFMSGVTVFDNKLYIICGVQGVHKEVVQSCFCYSVDSNTWDHILSPSQLRYNFSLVGVDGHLYAIGGEYERTLMSSVEVYDIKAGQWEFAAHLPRPAAAAACTKTLSRIFVCLWRPTETTEIYEYVSRADEWRLVTTLIRRQSYGHCIVGHTDNLYVIRNGPSDDFLRCMIDCFNLSTEQWTSLPGHFANSKGALFTAVVRCDSVLTVNRSLTLEYVIGGKNWKPRKQMKGFPRSGSLWTFLLRLPKMTS